MSTTLDMRNFVSKGSIRSKRFIAMVMCCNLESLNVFNPELQRLEIATRCTEMLGSTVSEDGCSNWKITHKLCKVGAVQERACKERDTSM